VIRAALTIALTGAAILVAAGHLVRESSPAGENSESPAVRTVEIDWSAEPVPTPPVKPSPPDTNEPVRTELEPASEPNRPAAAPVDFVPPEARAVAAPAPPQPELNDSTELVRRMLHLYRRHVGGE
jgi:hypothetical protein